MKNKTLLFYWSKGAEVRVKILKIIGAYNDEGKPVFSNKIAKELGLSHVAISKHLALLLENEYVKVVNPKGKPQYLELTEDGKKVRLEFTKKDAPRSSLEKLGF